MASATRSICPRPTPRRSGKLSPPISQPHDGWADDRCAAARQPPHHVQQRSAQTLQSYARGRARTVTRSAIAAESPPKCEPPTKRHTDITRETPEDRSIWLESLPDDFTPELAQA